MPKKTKTEKKEEKKEISGSVPTDEELKAIQEGRELVQKCKRLKSYAKEARQKTDWEWTVRNLFLRGYHFAAYNRQTNTVSFSTRTGVRIPINLLKAHMRGVRNQVTSFRPKWEVTPDLPTEQARENARYSGKVLDSVYVKAQIKRKVKELVTDGLWSSVGIWEFGMDKDGNHVISSVDPFEWFIDPETRSVNINDPDDGAEFVLKSVVRSVDAVKSNPKYENTEGLEAEERISESEYKRFLIQVSRRNQERANEDHETVILNEMYLRERNDQGNIKIRVVTFVDGIQDPLQNEILDENEYPFEIFQGEVAPRSVYSESWVKDLIPISRIIDALESHIFEYNHLFAKGRFIIDKNSGVRVIVNQHGQIIEKNRGAQVQAMAIPPLPATPFEQLVSMRRHFEDLSGVHDVSLGRIPAGVKSGVGIAELKQADATNQDDLVDNLEDFLARAGRRILKMASKNWDTAKMISVTGIGAQPELFMAIGEGSVRDKKKNKYTIGSTKIPLAIIGAESEVSVKIGSWLAYTKQARQEQLKELFRLGAIDQQTLLENLEFGDIGAVLDRTRTERILQTRGSQQSTSAQRQFGVDLTDEELALAENELLTEGTDQPVSPEDDHDVHLAIHAEIKDNEENSAIIRAHINEHLAQKRWMQRMKAQPLSPEEQAAQEGGGPPGPNGEAPPTMQPMPPTIGPGVSMTGGGSVGPVPGGPIPS